MSSLASQYHQRNLSQAFTPLVVTSRNLEDQTFFTVSEAAVLKALKKLNPRKAAGPDRIPNWLLRDYAEILVQPITLILNGSFEEQKLPLSWKLYRYLSRNLLKTL